MATVQHAITPLTAGDVIAYPTEAVYGLGCNPDNEQAVLKLLAIKQRPVEKGLILIAATYEQLRPYINEQAVPANRLDQILASWPGHFSWVFPASSLTPSWITGRFSSVAVRVSAHPVVQQLCLAYGKPLVSTSANLAGEPAITDYQQLQASLGNQISLIVDGPLGGATQPSQIRDALTGDIFRS